MASGATEIRCPVAPTAASAVSVSIRLDVIAASTDLRRRAAQTLTLFLSITLVAILFAIPGQPEWLFGAELIALAVVAGSRWSCSIAGRGDSAGEAPSGSQRQ